jgi:Fe/S biogenesis protein NfuA
MKDGWVEERHGDLAVIFPEVDDEKLDGASLDITDQGLAMNNPNSPAPPTISAPTGDLEGPLVDRVQQVLKEQVNPAIASHGGGAELVSVDGAIAYLRLYGGCQGCGLAQVTLKQGIERIILDSIPELTQVVDVTDHASGDDPYYQSQKK